MLSVGELAIHDFVFRQDKKRRVSGLDFLA